MHAGLACSLAQRDTTLRSSDRWCTQDSPVHWHRETLLFARLITGTQDSPVRWYRETLFARLIAGAHRTRLFTSTERSHSSDHWYTQRTGLFAGTESITHTALFTLTVFVLLICTELQTLVYTNSLICSLVHTGLACSLAQRDTRPLV